MGKFEPRPRVRVRISSLFRMSGSKFPLLLAPLVLAGGCAHRDVVDTPVGWFHQLQGGAIAKQRPPPPGVNDPYPKIGTTPAKAPEVASIEMRRTVTDALLRQRNLTTRIDANTPMPPPLPPAARSGQPAGQSTSSATLDAAQAGPAAANSASSAATAGSGAEGPNAASKADPAPELAMPALQLPPETAGNIAPVPLPAIPGAPPPPPRLRGLAVAAVPTADTVPDYDLTPATGSQISFVPNTDTLVVGQQGVLNGIASRRGAGKILVQGYGDAASTDPEAQAQAVSIAALRARSVAVALKAEGVPPDAIVLQADAFGRGASVSLLQ